MFRYIKSWYVLFRLRRSGQKYQKKASTSIPNNAILGSCVIGESDFIRELSCSSKIKKEKAKQREAQYRSIIEELSLQEPSKIRRSTLQGFMGPDNIEKHGQNPQERMIQITGAGEDFSYFSNFIVAFSQRYKILWFIIITLFGYFTLRSE